MTSLNLTPSSPNRTLFGMEPLLDVYREMNRMFDDVLRAPTAAVMRSMAAPKVDVHEKNGELWLLAEVPGVSPQDLDVQLSGDTLTISGEKQNEFEQDGANHYVMERSYGRFERTIQLPFAPKAEDAKASFENGVLRIRIPIEGAQRTRHIEIQIESVPSPDGTMEAHVQDDQRLQDQRNEQRDESRH
jgi:HSP20 family protein